MKPVRHIRRFAAVLSGLAAALVAFGAAPAFARPVPVPGDGFAPDTVPAPATPAPVRVIVTGGMPGWQIALIAVGAALLAAAVAVFLDRSRAARRKPATVAA